MMVSDSTAETRVRRPCSNFDQPLCRLLSFTPLILIVVAGTLVVFAAALIAAGEGLFDVCAGIFTLYVFQCRIHLAGNLIEFLAAHPGVQGGLESHAVERFVVGEGLAILGVVALFGATQTDPPLLARVVDRFSAGTAQQGTKRRG